uniref:probable inactive ribonuclease-like protein 13 n=1 Tax=Jaculus jaculus TaxID=51337 RepID=UPI0003333170|nr:probable inactive ribonuclease-like protein 13 [Jaculus jaculus]
MPSSVVQLFFLQLILGPTLVMDTKLQNVIQNFRTLHIDYPKVNYPKGFHGYCNGFMAYVRGRMQDWYCPKIHYVIHTPWEVILKFCKYSESFCENYNEYCTLTQETFPLTVCTLDPKQPPTSCHYSSTLTNQRLYLLCSQKSDAEPMGIIGVY